MYADLQRAPGSDRADPDRRERPQGHLRDAGPQSAAVTSARREKELHKGMKEGCTLIANALNVSPRTVFRSLTLRPHGLVIRGERRGCLPAQPTKAAVFYLREGETDE
jgi:hypothetical protein